MSRAPETALYLPIKAHFESLGFEVKSEVGSADVVALRDGDPPVIIELKTGFSLTLLQQAVSRQSISDAVYVAVPRWTGKTGWRAFKGNLGLCRRLGVGVITVRIDDGTVEVHDHPREYRPRKSKRSLEKLVGEFRSRTGDPNMGGQQGQRMTAYRQDAMRCLAYLHENGPARGAEIAKAKGVARATSIMANNYYGWFTRISRGIYGLSDTAPGAPGQDDARSDPEEARPSGTSD